MLCGELLPPLVPVGGLLTGVLGLTGSFGEWLAKLDESIKKGDVFYKGLKSIVDVVKGAITAVTGFAAAIGESLGFPGLDGATAWVKVWPLVPRTVLSLLLRRPPR